MNFRIYDVLSHLILGFLILSAFLLWKEIPLDNSYLLPATAAAFLVGYFVNTLSSWLEGIYFWTWKGNPGACTLAGKKCWKVTFNDTDRRKAIDLLSSNLEKKDDYKTMFSIAKRIAESNDTAQRLNTFNTNFAFSRVLLTTVLLIIPFILGIYSNSWLILVFTAILLFIA